MSILGVLILGNLNSGHSSGQNSSNHFSISQNGLQGIIGMVVILVKISIFLKYDL
jgi:hypothetical protein